ncbi:TPA: hypothetical protein PXN30_003701 [Yersinia enterocolitica]|uniref:hypothetical protein n=1 Tax=Yersinia TaxID=629 RepID=UPI0003D89D05|nr:MULTISPECIES: hypothetical protein [Yersinia]AKF38552.1 hypothetical protein FORC2_2405 [Yersinia enterocolitica]ALG44865.1 hypothetical protein LI89_09035 [Yersinia enterocolitica]EKN3341719.1 hypothetical protein [Yersinia enterocolitica]EKN3404541.1 hypothetical protein [Yersinia enterocolitica]EKN3527333.1 hypothetical protein [Yersinia enterocolitica]
MKFADNENMKKKIIEDFQRLQKQIYVDGDYITLNVDYPYQIPLSSCSTHEAILSHVIQLSEKNWMDLKLINYFIKIAAGANNIKINL